MLTHQLLAGIVTLTLALTLSKALAERRVPSPPPTPPPSPVLDRMAIDRTISGSDLQGQYNVFIESLVSPPAPAPHTRSLYSWQTLRNEVTKDDGAAAVASGPLQELKHIPISKEQLEKLLGVVMDTTFILDVLADDKQVFTDMGQGHRVTGLLGRIPVHFKIQEMTVGGVTLPRVKAESLNLKTDPVNFGNIEE